MKGSHNTLTFAAPRYWWGWLLLPFWRNQTKNIVRQIFDGIRAFDIRFVRDDSMPSGWRSAHGLVDLDIDPLQVIEYLGVHSPGVYIRCILEKGTQEDVDDFSALCENLEHIYPVLHFYEGIFKPEWRRVHVFTTPEAHIAEGTSKQYYGSHCAWWKGAIPRLWWFKHRHDKVMGWNNTAHPIVFKDFV